MLPTFLSFPDQPDGVDDESGDGAMTVSAQSGDVVILAIRHQGRRLVDLVFEPAEARALLAALSSAADLAEAGEAGGV